MLLCSLNFALDPRRYCRALATAGFSRIDRCEQVCFRVIRLPCFWIPLCITLPFPTREREGQLRRRWLYLRAIPLGVSWNGKRGTAMRTGGRVRVRGIALGSSGGEGRCITAGARDGVPFPRF